MQFLTFKNLVGPNPTGCQLSVDPNITICIIMYYYIHNIYPLSTNRKKAFPFNKSGSLAKPS